MIRRILFAFLGFLASFIGTWVLFLLIAMVSPAVGRLSYDLVLLFMTIGGVVGTVVIFWQGAPRNEGESRPEEPPPPEG